MDDVMMSRFDFIAPFYSQAHDRTSLIKGLDALLSSESLFVRAIPFSCSLVPSSWFPTILSNSRKISLRKSNTGVQLFELSYFFKENKVEQKESGRFFIYEHPEFKDVYLALTIESSNFFNRALLPFIQSLYPQNGLTFITHKRLRKLIEEFQAKNNYTDIIITRASHRLRFEEEGKHKKIIPMVSWPNMELSEAFDWVYQNNGWFQSLQFEAKMDSSSIAEVSFTRQGVIRTNNILSKVYDSFLYPVCKTIHENIMVFGHRSRRDSKDLSAKPLIIDFETDQFSDVSENKKFIQSMKRLRSASTSVLHGNPYIHMSIIDYYDGSTFDLWVLSSSQVVIVPQMKGSIQAIKRLINHIFDTYAEGDIKDYEDAIK
jgi:hypothetical protein